MLTAVQILVREVAFTAGARRQLGELQAELHDACLGELRDQYEGQELSEGDHVQALVLEQRVVRANLFVDKNGILWVESLRLG